MSQTDEAKTLHFILLDGTWNNSAAMLKRLKVQADHISHGYHLFPFSKEIA